MLLFVFLTSMAAAEPIDGWRCGCIETPAADCPADPTERTLRLAPGCWANLDVPLDDTEHGLGLSLDVRGTGDRFEAGGRDPGRPGGGRPG